MGESLLHQWSMIRSIISILQWWFFNVAVIIMNKWIFQKLDFKFPLTVSCIHFICSAIGAYLVIKVLKLKPLIVVDPEDRWRRIFPMSFVFCINIVLGNVSLRYIPISFMQTIKSFTPATTVILQWLVWGKHFDWRIWTSLIPIVGGILLTSVTELSFNIFGFCAALVGCLATATKTILAESLLHGYKFDSINTVFYMAPFATMILGLPALLLEGLGVIEWLNTHPTLLSSFVIIVGSGVLAFCLNFSIFYVIHSTTAVTFNVAGNLKWPRKPVESHRLSCALLVHILSLIGLCLIAMPIIVLLSLRRTFPRYLSSQVAVAVTCSWLIFRNPISALNAVGCGVTLLGCTFYGYVRQLISQQPQETLRSPRTPRSMLESIPLVNEKSENSKDYM